MPSTSGAAAPSAIRIPISRVRRRAACAGTEGRDYIDPILLEHTTRLEASDRPEEAREKIGQEIKGKDEWTVRDCIDLACLLNDRLLARGETYYQAVVARDLITAAPKDDLNSIRARQAQREAALAKRRGAEN